MPYLGLLYHAPEKEWLTNASEFPMQELKGAYSNPLTPVEHLEDRSFTLLVFVHVRILDRQDLPCLRYSNTRE